MSARDYRENQFRRDWWDQKVPYIGMTRNEVMWVVVGIVLAVIYIKFPINWDWVFGLR